MVRFLTDKRVAPTPATKPEQKQDLLVIGAGLPRTATSSLQAALEELNLTPCLHMAQIIPHTSRQELLIATTHIKDTATRQKQLHTLVSGYAAVCDMPAIFFLSDLMDMYPDARVILTTRPNAETWAESCRESLGFFFTRWFAVLGLLWGTERLWYRLNMRILEWCRERFGAEEDIFSLGLYERYNEFVREVVRERGKELLEFKAENGWGPLCAFLGREVPGTDFPRVNERKTFAFIKRVLVLKGVVSWMVLGGSAWLAWRYGLALFLYLVASLGI
ncbi:hypothetical protein PEX1_023020 [Penicillium expansum]|uniref:Uncharacterized protein n=1 Tax=Penicillium expansum TaxID=27334 RepID=A0A0A2JRC9_PENEN|nr:hypothetical protein PEX2_041220 [Penicillium expansum]KGO57992.1 hypothetical protein PEX2_041220 [Penicillium expansum]KGO72199.1 hypothetical protein PEX1_023020 [Penicillium expansum]